MIRQRDVSPECFRNTNPILFSWTCYRVYSKWLLYASSGRSRYASGMWPSHPRLSEIHIHQRKRLDDHSRLLSWTARRSVLVLLRLSMDRSISCQSSPRPSNSFGEYRHRGTSLHPERGPAVLFDLTEGT